MTIEPGSVIEFAWITVAVVWLAGMFVNKQTVKRQSIWSRLLEMLPLLLGVILLRGDYSLALWATTRFVPDTFGWECVGAALTVAGLAVAIWARFYLGRNWSGTVTVKKDHQFIRSGPYSVVRHPIYSGFLLAILGTAIYVGQIRGLIALALVLVAWKIKSRREESFMESEFGEQYVQYEHEVKGLVPFVW
jgi:protein-S-isoprenylcysteine O-methyltransferase Ste14